MEATDPARIAARRRERTDEVRARVLQRAHLAAERAQRTPDLHLDVADGTLAMPADYFIRLADELLDNAFKFSQPGQPVTVRTVAEPGWLTLSVADQGAGMSAEQRANLSAYAQFNRAEQEQQGSGLGLAIVQRVAALHGGTLELRPGSPGGTTALVRLPAAPPEPAS
jgi:signal transduction histidine kinase